MRMNYLCLATFAAVIVAACGGSSADDTGDTSDAGGSGGSDSGTSDGGNGTGAGTDAGSKTDSGAKDSGTPTKDAGVDPLDGTPVRKTCTDSLGNGLSAVHGRLDGFLYGRLSDIIIGATITVFIFSFVRSQAEDRRRIGWMIVAFAFAGAARLASDTFYPARIGPWENGMLLALTPLPIVAVWVAVLRHRFFNVDFVVSRAVVYVAITAGIIGAVTLIEELGTYNFYMNTDFAYGFLIVFSMAVGAATNRIRPYVEHVVDRFIFRNRHSQREALEIIGGYILDAEHVEDVYRALLEDATHALGLSFAGILARHDDGSYRLERNYAWPADCVVTLDRGDELIQHISRSRGALTFSGKESRLIRKAFPNERLTFAAPLFFDRSVSAIVVYGHSVSGLDLDPEERDQLVRVVAHASIALHQIELARYRAAAPQNVVPLGAR